VIAGDLLVAASPYVFVALVASACGVAALLGGAEGRWTAFLYTAALLTTRAADEYDRTWGTINVPIAVIDTALLVGFYVVALNSRRWWPLWITALQLLTVSAHLSAWLAPRYVFRAYFALAVIWSLPKMVILLIGVLVDWRRDHDVRPDPDVPPP
jgi:hypothetical protein